MLTRILIFSAASLSLCGATETVCLKSGFCLSADSHATSEQSLVLSVGSGRIEVPIGEVNTIETAPAAIVPKVDAIHAVAGPIDPEILLRQAAEREGLDVSFVRSVARIESGIRQTAISSKGAIGLMQLMPSTAATLGVDASQAEENALGGAKYLRALLLQYNNNSALALAAYNAGPKAVQRFGGVPPFEETRKYVVNVIREYYRQQRLETAKLSAAAKLPTRQ